MAFCILLLYIRFDLSSANAKETYLTLDGTLIDTPVTNIANFILYFVMKDGSCEEPLDELLVYHKLKTAYSGVTFSVIFHDPDLIFFNKREELAFQLERDFGFKGSIFFDYQNSFINHNNSSLDVKVLIFDKKNRKISEIIPNITGSQRQRFRLYFLVAREYL